MMSLNRFEYDLISMERIKLKDRFTYPLHLDMASYMEEKGRKGGKEGEVKVMYDLAGVVIHQVGGVGRGLTVGREEGIGVCLFPLIEQQQQ